MCNDGFCLHWIYNHVEDIAILWRKPSERRRRHSTLAAGSLRRILLQRIFIGFPVFLKTTWLLCFGRTLGGEAVIAAPLLLVLHLQLVHHLLVQKTLVPTLALVVEEPCQAEEI